MCTFTHTHTQTQRSSQSDKFWEAGLPSSFTEETGEQKGQTTPPKVTQLVRGSRFLSVELGVSQP